MGRSPITSAAVIASVYLSHWSVCWAAAWAPPTAWACVHQVSQLQHGFYCLWLVSWDAFASSHRIPHFSEVGLHCLGSFVLAVVYVPREELPLHCVVSHCAWVVIQELSPLWWPLVYPLWFLEVLASLSFLLVFWNSCVELYLLLGFLTILSNLLFLENFKIRPRPTDLCLLLYLLSWFAASFPGLPKQKWLQLFNCCYITLSRYQF